MTTNEYHREWTKKNKEKARAIQKRYYENRTEEQKEHRREYMRKWREANKDKIQLYNLSYKRRKRIET